MTEYQDQNSPPEFDMQDGLSLALAYLEDPSSIPCPRCGPERMEVVCFLDARGVDGGVAVPTAPDGDYTVVLFCHTCGRAAALDLSRPEGTGRGTGREAA